MKNIKDNSTLNDCIFIGAIGILSGAKKLNITKLIAEGNDHYRKGKLAEALNAYNQALQIDPENYVAWNNRGLILAVAGNFNEALKCHLRAVELNPKHVDAISNIGMTYTKLKLYDEAMKWYDKALKLDPKHETTWNNKGNLLSKLEMYEEALNCYDRALQINPNYMAAMNNKAVELIHIKKYTEALTLLNQVLKTRPLFAEGWYVKGKAFIGMKEFDKAIVCLERATRLNPEFEQARRALDVLKKKLVEEPGEKIKAPGKKQVKTAGEQAKIDRAIQTEILKPRTEMEIVGDEFERPEEHLTKEERIALEYVTNEQQLTTILKNAAGSTLSKPALDMALEGLKQKGLIESKKQGNSTSYVRTQTLGSIDEEIIEAKEKREPEELGNDLHALLSRSKKFIDSGRYKEAASILKKALKINPYDDITICLLAQTQFEMGERDKAINTISKILSRKPEFIPAWFTLANATFKRGDYVDAAECFHKILELQPDNAEARKGFAASERALK